MALNATLKLKSVNSALVYQTTHSSSATGEKVCVFYLVCFLWTPEKLEKIPQH